LPTGSWSSARAPNSGANHRLDHGYGSLIVSRFKPRDTRDRVFEIGIILKGLDGVLETIGGLLLLAVTPATINDVVSRLTQHELSRATR